MPYLQNEKSRVQAEIQKLESDAANLTTQIDVQQQAVASAKTKVDDARSKLAGLQAQRPALAAAATSADQKVDGINQQIQEHEQNEPEKSIERPNKPPLPNPEWKTWNKRMEELRTMRRTLVHLVDRCHGDDRPDCPILEELAGNRACHPERPA
jgi:chromosome segregation ATPase